MQKRQRTLLTSPHGKLQGLFGIPLRRIPQKEVDMHVARLTYVQTPSQHDEAPPPPIHAAHIEDDWLWVPRVYGIDRFSFTVSPQGEKRDLGQFLGSLRPHQVEASQRIDTALTRKHSALLVLGCGMGKTVSALHTVHRRQSRTVVLVEKRFLLEQWIERIHTFLPDAKVGVYCQKQQETGDDVDICVAMIQSVLSSGTPTTFHPSFRLCIVDEAHHIAARTFSTVMRYVPAQEVLGLSATPHRSDGLSDLVEQLVGRICYSNTGDAAENCQAYIHRYPIPGKTVLKPNGDPNVPVMLTLMGRDFRRLCYVCERISEVAPDRNLLVLSERVDHLQRIQDRLSSTYDIGSDVYVGSTKKKDREAIVTKERRGNTVLLSTYAMASEALDIPPLDTLVLATPKWKMEQVMGRILRTLPGKKTPVVVDVVDNFSVFARSAQARRTQYKRMGATVHES
jgi:superfamily II DNA or RNA helicase